MENMLSLSRRVSAFVKLGNVISNLSFVEKEDLFRRMVNQNNWFTPQFAEEALKGIAYLTREESLNSWLSSYDFPDQESRKKIGILMAGNIPGVGFHDLMTVLLSGNDAHVRLSSGDGVLMSWIIQKLQELESSFISRIQIQDQLKSKDAYIATGSDNSSRYFNYYFGKYPSVIRSNRTSLAILDGTETAEDFHNLGKDIFYYFGLGCRNVSKIFVKSETDLVRLLDGLESFSFVQEHHKYLNNYEYNKSIYLVNKEHHLDNGFLILKPSTELVSPIGVLFYEVYSDRTELDQALHHIDHKIQCILTKSGAGEGEVAFGQAQSPNPWDYADRVDTLQFLLDLA